MFDAVVIGALGLIVATAGVFVWVWIDEARRPRLTCLLYHRFTPTAEYANVAGAERAYQVPLDRFERQLRHLRDRGYHAVTADQAAAFVAGTLTLPQPAVHLTIDDGSLSVLEHAQPLLARHGLRATLFLVTDETAHVFTGSGERRMTDEEVGRLDPDVVEVQSHAVSHRPLVTLDDDALRDELEASRATIATLVGRSADHLGIPGGWYDHRVLHAAAAAGYRGVFVSDAGANRPGRDRMRIRRLNVDGFADLKAFAALFDPFSVAQIRFFRAIRRWPATVLGARAWLPLRQRLRGSIRAEALSFQAMRRVGMLLAGGLLALVLWWAWSHWTS